jgi:hypothetical protein
MSAPSFDNQPRVRRTKTAELTRVDGDNYTLTARLTDVSFHGDYGDGSATGTIHDFTLVGTLAGADLMITSLRVDAVTHPYAQCPAILSSVQSLLGASLGSGWRRTVLANLGSTAGCTHVTTLLLGLAEVRTMAFFLQMNDQMPYSAPTRSDGRWTAVGLQIAPSIVGACHVLSSNGPIVESARELKPVADAASD